MKKIIAGIQQIGIGVDNAQEAFKWYRNIFGMDIPVFEEAAEATPEPSCYSCHQHEGGSRI
jgi:catechol 2,3-dioxygenase-like lactoylglutathione lyase family enzyme